MIRRKRPVDKHKNVLVRSSRDQQVFCIAVNEKYREMCLLCRRIRGVDLVPPESLMPDIVRWRQMFVRHNQSHDMRHTAEELQSLEAVAQYTLVLDKELRGQEPPPPLEFDWGKSDGH